MNILEQLAGTLDARTLQGLGQAIGATPEQTQAAVQVALPTLLTALGRNSATPEGAAALHHAVQRDHAQVDLGSLVGGLLGGLQGGSGAAGGGGLGGLLGAVAGMMGGAAAQPTGGGGLAQSGAAILKHVLGGAQPRAADGVAKGAGISPAAAAQLMAMLAPLVMGALGRMQQQNGLDAGGLAKAIQQDAGRVGAAPGQGGGFASLLDTDGDGDVDVADLMRHGSTLFTMFGKR
ncbi:MAG: DUF937 domain-containing protein [Xanthomonadales bacterium]|jgi:hypothetical protein|nr:DUF937 domain-containing protein [Xanthomonadales bacterium]